MARLPDFGQWYRMPCVGSKVGSVLRPRFGTLAEELY